MLEKIKFRQHSKLIENIRAVLYQESDYRRKLLDKVGLRIYDGWIRRKENVEWLTRTTDTKYTRGKSHMPGKFFRVPVDG